MPQLQQTSISAIPPVQNGQNVYFFMSNDIVLQPQSCALIPLNHKFINVNQNFCF